MLTNETPQAVDDLSTTLACHNCAIGQLMLEQLDVGRLDPNLLAILFHKPAILLELLLRVNDMVMKYSWDFHLVGARAVAWAPFFGPAEIASLRAGSRGR